MTLSSCGVVVRCSTADGARISQYDVNGGTNQQWQLVRLGAGPGDTVPAGCTGTGTGTPGSTPVFDGRSPALAAITVRQVRPPAQEFRRRNMECR